MEMGQRGDVNRAGAESQRGSHRDRAPQGRPPNAAGAEGSAAPPRDRPLQGGLRAGEPSHYGRAVAATTSSASSHCSVAARRIAALRSRQARSSAVMGGSRTSSTPQAPTTAGSDNVVQYFGW